MAEMMIESPDEVVAFLKAQHNLIEDMFDEVLLASDPEAREKPFAALRQLLAAHETAEEMLVHPRVRREADAGNAIVDARLKEEHDAKELLSQIEKLDITSQHFIDELTTLRQAVLEHAENEEIDEFPYLETGLDVNELKRMCEALEAEVVIFDHDLSPRQIANITGNGMEIWLALILKLIQNNNRQNLWWSIKIIHQQVFYLMCGSVLMNYIISNISIRKYMCS